MDAGVLCEGKPAALPAISRLQLTVSIEAPQDHIPL